MEYASGLIKLKPGSEERVAEWRSTIISRLDEAAATLKDEDVQVESWFTIEIGGVKYLLWYMRAKSIKRVFEVSQQLKHPIDTFHYEVMEAITAANIFAGPFIDIPRGKVSQKWPGLGVSGAIPHQRPMKANRMMRSSKMRVLVLTVACTLSFVAPQAIGASALSEGIAGSYDILICNGACSFGKQTNAIVKGRMVLFANGLEKVDLQRFDENRLEHHHGESINGCFTLDSVGKSISNIGIEKIGVTSWSKQGGLYRFSLFHSVDAGYAVELQRTKTGLAGTGTFWGAGAAAPKEPGTEAVIARRTGGADISRCTFQTAEEHEYRRLLADPARNDIFAIEEVYSQKLLSALQNSTTAGDWAMAGWIQRSEAGEAQILRAREAAPNNRLIRWMTAVRTHAYAVAAAEKGMPSGSILQYRELCSDALAELQHLEPGNATWWLMSLRNAVYHNDLIAADAALARVAASDYYDDHAAELLKAQLTLYQSHPLPDEYFAAVARLDRGWRLNGEFTKDTAPYYENHYPWAEIGIKNLFNMDVESGMNEMFVLCVQRPDRDTARKDACLNAARMLAARARREAVREAASMLLSEGNDFVNDDVRRARVQQWIGLKFYEIIKPAGADSQLASISAETAFVKDWIESSDETKAMQRAVERGRKPLQPPEDFRLNESWFGNFERARAN